MTKENIIESLSQYTGTQVRVAICDIDGILRGKIMHKQKVLKALEDGFGFCDVIFGWDSGDALYEKDSVTGWGSGFADAKATLDPLSYRRLPWHNHIPMLLADFSESLASVCPRSILKKQADKASRLGFEAHLAMEFEWFNFKKDVPKEPISQGMYGYSLLRASQFQELWSQWFDQLEEAGIPLEGMHTETGPGAMEAAIQHAPALEAGDRAVLFKSAIKEIASQHGVLPSFMAKWSHDLPGCSGHLHQSLSQNGRSSFYGKDGHLSLVGEHYLAGVLLALPDLMPLYAPTINSYKRLVPGSWAPTTVSWGVENRTAACRVIGSSERQTRIELRVTGADNNPYLAMAASLASGLYGIENKLSLDIPELKGNAYDSTDYETLPNTLKEATHRMKNSDLARQLLGDHFVDHFVMTRMREVTAHEKNVSNWERNRYMEVI